ncbi:MAG: hypothetical protein FRX49_04478 [Trebouxia sp. A1-2]|nr:MAG: hypothetical protein FRX49_04478 [Trebouxia sp. A1-2]
MSAGFSQPTKRDAPPFLRPHVLSEQVFDNPYKETKGLVGGSARTNKDSASRGLQRTTGSGGSGTSASGALSLLTNPYSVQIVADSRKNSFSAPDEVLLERKGSADSQSSLGPERPFSEPPIHNDRLADSRAEAKPPEWLSPAQTRTSSLHNDTENYTNSEIIAHIDHEQSFVLDSLQHLHQKLDGVAKHLGVTTSGHKPLPSLISAHRGSDHDVSADMEHDQQMDSLISQVEATLQHPLAQAPATADIASRSESSSIGAAVRKQLDLVGEQLAQKAHAGPHEGEAGRLATQVSNLSQQLHAAQAATAAAQQETNNLRHKQQELTSLREQLLAAESATAGAVKESTHLRQQLRSMQSRSGSQATLPEQAELTRQVTPVIDQLLRETYTALRDEFQSDVMYKGAEIEHVLKSVMRKQVMVGKQAVLDLASQPQADRDMDRDAMLTETLILRKPPVPEFWSMLTTRLLGAYRKLASRVETLNLKALSTGRNRTSNVERVGWRQSCNTPVGVLGFVHHSIATRALQSYSPCAQLVLQRDQYVGLHAIDKYW